jgi:AraC-like DNA-binding protein
MRSTASAMGPNGRSWLRGCDVDAFTALVARHATVEGRSDALYPGVYFYRATRPARFRKALAFGPTLTLVAQGRKVARFGALQLHYAPCHYLVVTGEVSFDGEILEATPARPYLAVCVELPCDLIAKTLLALADAKVAPGVERAPAFVSPADPAIKDTVTRLLDAIDDPLERQIVTPLVLEELVFRLLRTDAAAVLRSAVARDRDAEHIQQAMRYIRAHATRPLTVEEVARHVAMSPSHFAHRFRAAARTSPMRYLKQIRLQEARALLISDGLRVSEVAARVGYESASHFTRDFKTYFGTAPAEYVRRFRIAGKGQRSAAPGIVDSDRTI